ncbi:arginase/agmatinase/formimionoglutamate hydrolase [Vibrio ichthyoenteri ATCC 700023]|uniref:Arginase/agmatinase/formimionoglutamate hydrolase n=1 Tax=Vibrio ichthyoenteri ATCC 700023 TaxID=870968 RepID=F9S4T3_9VIBR|nr:arginase family protein [Vibrio ichthyoenteri]EGU36482.1 arginase/agmatinase/formimionoglutamate hydrolase [Vibrio ichthyoenteri ATCC 700023]
MPRAFDIIGAPFNQLGCYQTTDNTVDGLRRLSERSWTGLTEWIAVRNQRWGADINDCGDVQPTQKVFDLIAQEQKESALTDYCEALKTTVFESYQNQRVPITIGGDHSIAVATIQATLDYYQKRQGKRVAVIWVDAHADCNNSLASNLHSKPLALLMDQYPHNNWHVEPELVPDPSDVYYVAVRDLMPNEHQLMQRYDMVNFDMTIIESHGIDGVLKQLLEKVEQQYDCVYLSFDYDALDGSLFRACATPNVGGLSAREALHLVFGIAQHPKFVGADFVEYLPEKESEEMSKELMIKLIDAVWGFRT